MHPLDMQEAQGARALHCPLPQCDRACTQARGKADGFGSLAKSAANICPHADFQDSPQTLQCPWRHLGELGSQDLQSRKPNSNMFTAILPDHRKLEDLKAHSQRQPPSASTGLCQLFRLYLSRSTRHQMAGLAMLSAAILQLKCTLQKLMTSHLPGLKRCSNQASREVNHWLILEHMRSLSHCITS